MKNKIIVLFLFFICLAVPLVLFVSCSGDENKQKETGHLFLIEKNGSFGYISNTGRIVIQPKFERANDFYEGLAKVRLRGDNKGGFIDKTGEFVIKPRIDIEDDRFSDGLVVIRPGGAGSSTCGFIDKTGKTVIEPRLDSFIEKRTPYRFSEGLAAIYDKKTDSCGYIDKTGQFIIKPQFDCFAGDFHEGLAYVRLVGDDKSGCIDKTGKFVIKPQFPNDSFGFSDGLLYTSSTTGPCLGEYIDKTGQIVISREQLGCTGIPHRFSEGLAYVNYELSHQGDGACKPKPGFANRIIYIDKAGNVVINIEGPGGGKDFSEGLAVIYIGGYVDKIFKGKYGYIDKTGTLVIKPQFDAAMSFHNGLARVCLGDEWGYINKTGKYIWKSDGLNWLKIVLVFVILVLFVGLFVTKYRRSKKQSFDNSGNATPDSKK